MQMERGMRETAPQGARYVFAGTGERGTGDGTKTCPRCGQVLFDDMDVCYGCLYDFTRDRHGAMRETASDEGPVRASDLLRALPRVTGDPLATIELDEIDDEPEERPEGDAAVTPPRIPRHRKSEGSADDTLDLARERVADEGGHAGAPAVPLVVVSSVDMRVTLPVGPQGITVGRDEANDVVLGARSVSRRHVRLCAAGSRVMVQDLGATNPALLEGRPLEGSAVMERGDVLDVCGTTIALA